MNKAMLAGPVVTDPKISVTTGGKKVANFRMATGEGKPTYHTIVAWEKLADYVQSSVVRGSLVLVEGRIQNRSYEAKDGSGKRWLTEIVANLIEPATSADPAEEPTVPGF